MYVYLTYNVYRYIMDSDFCLRFFILRGWVGWGRVFSPESREYRIKLHVSLHQQAHKTRREAQPRILPK